MSVKVQALIWSRQIPMAEKVVLLRLADRASDDGAGIWESVDATSLYCGCSRRNVQTVIQKYVKAGILTVVAQPYQWSRRGKKIPTTLYRMNVKRVQDMHPVADRKRVQDMHPVDQDERVHLLQGESPARVQDVRKEGAGGAPKPLKNQREDSNESSHTVDHFETFWAIYPSRRPHSNPKKPARQKFEGAVKRGVDPQEILAGAQRYAQYAARHIPDPKHIAQAITWLRQERWDENHEEIDYAGNPEYRDVSRDRRSSTNRNSAHQNSLIGAVEAIDETNPAGPNGDG